MLVLANSALNSPCLHLSVFAVTSRVFEALGLLQNADVAQLLSPDVQNDVNLIIAILSFAWIFALLALLLEAMRRLQ